MTQFTVNGIYLVDLVQRILLFSVWVLDVYSHSFMSDHLNHSPSPLQTRLAPLLRNMPPMTTQGPHPSITLPPLELNLLCSSDPVIGRARSVEDITPPLSKKIISSKQSISHLLCSPPFPENRLSFSPQPLHGTPSPVAPCLRIRNTAPVYHATLGLLQCYTRIQVCGKYDILVGGDAHLLWFIAICCPCGASGGS